MRDRVEPRALPPARAGAAVLSEPHSESFGGAGLVENRCRPISRTRCCVCVPAPSLSTVSAHDAALHFLARPKQTGEWVRRTELCGPLVRQIRTWLRRATARLVVASPVIGGQLRRCIYVRGKHLRAGRPTDQMFCRDRVREYSRGSTDDEFYWRCDEWGGRSDVRSYSCLKPLGTS